MTLPSSLQSLSCGWGVNQSLERVTLPSSLQKLETCRLTDLAPSELYVSLNETPMTDTNVLQSPAAISSKNCCLRWMLRQFELQFQGERNTVTCLGSNAMSGRENYVKCVRYHLFPPMTFLQIPLAVRKAN